METGLIQVYCGDGKGKTTASVGLAIRCIGGGGKVLFFQFMKNGKSGECNVLKSLQNVTFLECYSNIKFSNQMSEQEKYNASIFYNVKLDEIQQMVLDKDYQMLIMDEIMSAISTKFLDEEKLIYFLKNKPNTLEVIMTGRNPSEKILELADYVSKINKIKHPFDKGIYARKLIEF